MKKIILAFLLIISMIIMTGCDPTQVDPLDGVAVTQISIKTQASKLSFAQGEDFSSAGLILEALYQNGHKRTVDATGYDVDDSKFDKATEGFYDIKVSLKTAPELFLEYMVKVGNPAISPVSIAVKTNPTKKNYYLTENFDPSGLVIRATNNDKSKKDLESGEYNLDISAFDNTAKGTYKINVILGSDPNIKTSFLVTVEVKVSSLVIRQHAAKLEYFRGESFVYSGLIVQALFENLTKADLHESLYTIDFSDFDNKKNAPGVANIVIKLKADTSKSVTYSVEIFEASSIEIIGLPIDLVFPPKSEFACRQISVVAKYGTANAYHYISASEFIVDSSAFNSNQSKDYEIVVKYKANLALTDSYTVNVQGVQSIAIKAKPLKTQYYIGEVLNLYGLTVEAAYSATITEQLLPDNYIVDSSAFRTIPGTYTIKVLLKNDQTLTATFEVNVFEAHSIRVSTTSQHPQIFGYGLDFSASGLKIDALYGTSGEFVTLDLSFINIDLAQFKRIMPGTYPIKVSLKANQAIACEYYVSITPREPNKIVELYEEHIYGNEGHLEKMYECSRRTYFAIGSEFSAEGLFVRGRMGAYRKNSDSIIGHSLLNIDSSLFNSSVTGEYTITVSLIADPTLKFTYKVAVVAADKTVIRFETRFSYAYTGKTELSLLGTEKLSDYTSGNYRESALMGYKFVAYYLDSEYSDLIDLTKPISDYSSWIEDNMLRVYMKYDRDYSQAYTTNQFTDSIYLWDAARYFVDDYSSDVGSGNLIFNFYQLINVTKSGNYTASGFGAAGYSNIYPSDYTPLRIFEYKNSTDEFIDLSKEVLSRDVNGNYLGYNLVAGKKYVVCSIAPYGNPAMLAPTVKITVSLSPQVAAEFGLSTIEGFAPKGTIASNMIFEMFGDLAQVLGGRFEFYTDVAMTTVINYNTAINGNTTYYMDLLPQA